MNFVLPAAAVIFALIFISDMFRSDAASGGNSTPGSAVTLSSVPELPNFDIRTSKSDKDVLLIDEFRREAGADAASIAAKRDEAVHGENELRTQIPDLKVEYSREMSVPEVISPDVWRTHTESLSAAGPGARAETLRSFVKQNDQLFGVDPGQADLLEVVADYENPSGNMAFALLEQKIFGVPVFGGEVKAGFKKDGSMFRVINGVTPGLDYESIPADFGDPEDALRFAAGHIGHELGSKLPSAGFVDDNKAVFGPGDSAPVAEKVYFPISIGVARPAWKVLIWQPVNAFYVVVDAKTGAMLWRKNITEDQTQSATFEVYRNINGYIDVAESPAPLTPGPIDPSNGTQGSLLTRENVTLIGNEGPNSFNNNGWITDGGNTTDGNAVEAGLDRDGTDGVDAPVTGNNRVFSSAWNPPPGNPAPGDLPTVQAARDGAVIQMFYVTNRYHDVMYQLGFTEQAFNFQHDNFGRGGNGNDRVRAEGQDSSGINNANFSTPSDGGRGRMQMYVFNHSNPDRDGTTDADVIIHELTHGLSNRLHGNSTGLSGDMARAMGEGWSDFYAHALLAEPTDPINGVYTIGGYLLTTPTYFGNYYYGIRSLPKAVMSFTGGTGNRPHNSLTFADIDQAQSNNFDAAFSPRFGPNFNSPHYRGEVWSSALWEIRGLMVARLGFAEGTRRVLQIVTDGMKLAPSNPTYLQERDAIIAAAFSASASPEASADVLDVWEGFRIRGMGFSARVIDPAAVTVEEAFDMPNVFVEEPGFEVSDAPGDNDSFPEPGEPLALTVPLKNNSGTLITGVTVSVNGGPAVSYGDIADGSTVTRQISFTVPPQQGCGSVLDLDLAINGSRGARQETRTIVVGAPAAEVAENFDSVTAPALPAGWTSAQTGPGLAFATQSGSAETAPNSAFTPNRGLAGGNSGATLDSVEYAIASTASLVTFRNRYNTEAGWDGGVLEISVNGGGFVDILDAGGSFVEGGYNGTLGVNQNPLDGRAAWTGNSGGYITTVAKLPESANGQNVRLRFSFGEDTNTFAVGWNIDSLSVAGESSCDFTGSSSSGAPFDFDGDGATDVSVFRPNSQPTAQWWLLRSSDSGTRGLAFGSSTDVPVAADFTGDGKTDVAFWRPSTGEWFILRSEDDSFFAFPFGSNGDIPAPGDFDGDGKADPAVYRPTSGTWFIVRSSDGGLSVVPFGVAADQPIVADYDGDGKDDVGVYRAPDNQFWLLRSTDGVKAFQFGAPGDRTAVGDWTGDGKADVAFFRPSSSEWYVIRSEDDSFFAFPWGATGDIPSPGDFDGDGKFDPAVWRPSDRTWYIFGTTSGFEAVQFGSNGDVPLPSSVSVQ
ncbi:MAG: M36 family metallopeptidase [Aridibacter famidurans]|nr:M36 family metallopeptidase [Aridibacter famidurans]